MSEAKYKKRLKILRDHGIRVTNSDDQDLLLVMAEALVASDKELGIIRAAKALHRRYDEYERMQRRSITHLKDGAAVTSELACRKGCSYCCTIRVTAMAAEILVAAEYIHITNSQSEVEATIESLAAYDRQAEGMSPTERVYTPRMCPLNVGGECSIYAARPLACRRYHSFDVDACKRDVEDPYGGDQVPADPQRYIPAFTRGPQKVFEEFGVDTRELEFVTGLRICLEQNDVPARLLRGEDVFADAHRSDYQAIATDAHEAARGFGRNSSPST